MNPRTISGARGETRCYANNEGGEGTPILVLHGGPGFGSDPALTEVLGLKSPMYFYDQYGCGGSNSMKDPSEYTVDAFMDQIDEVRAEYSLDSVILMGMCWGAGLATSYASRKGARGVKAMILSSPFLSLDLWERDQRANLASMPEPERSALQRYEAEENYSMGYRKALIPYFQRFYFTRGDASLISQLVMGRQPEVYRRMWGESELFCKGALSGFDAMRGAGGIDCPVLLIGGDRDVVSAETMEAYRDGFRDAQLAIVPNSGHMIYNEQLSIVKAIVKSFVREIDNRPKKNLPSSMRSSL
ncbi:MAG: alpha/beta fold hydrolase [Candidatus Methanoplasma sp.]|jgi:proline iminopeptidase|nr:alpha/beta fold hydrolase [Candidatus Methanoplasma sp.]